MKGPEPAASDHRIAMKKAPSDSPSQFRDPACSFAICDPAQCSMPFLASRAARRHYSQHMPLAKNLLHIVVAGAKLLTPREMKVALAIEEGSKSYEDVDLKSEISFRTKVVASL